MSFHLSNPVVTQWNFESTHNRRMIQIGRVIDGYLDIERDLYRSLEEGIHLHAVDRLVGTLGLHVDECLTLTRPDPPYPY